MAVHDLVEHFSVVQLASNFSFTSLKCCVTLLLSIQYMLYTCCDLYHCECLHTMCVGVYFFLIYVLCKCGRLYDILYVRWCM
jgi:hypothetical protein